MREGLREADSAACSEEDVELGHLLHLGILTAERKRQGAPGVHTEEGNPSSTCLDACFQLERPAGEPLALECGWDRFV